MNVAVGAISVEAEASPPRRAGVPALVLAHPHPQMGGDMHNKIIDRLFRRSAERGWGVVRFNFRGVGASTGAWDEGNGEVDDFLGVLLWASGTFGVPVAGFTLTGYSFGSWIAARTAARLPEIRQVVLIAPPVRTMDFSPLGGVRHSKRVFAAERDEYASAAETEAWFAGLEPPKTLSVIPGADHAFIGTTTQLVRAVLRAMESD